MITVIIPLYNKEISVEKTLKSVINQSYKNIEILIIDDGSTDNSINAAKKIEDQRIRIVEKENGGVSSARNLGIKEAKYNWVALLDADDIWLENHLLNAVEVIDTFKDVCAISSGFAKAKKDGTIIREFHVKSSGFYDFFSVSLEIGFAVNSSSIFFDKSKFQETFFDERLTKGEDTKFWEELAKKESFYFISQITSLYIDDAENKAIYKYHDLNLTHIYNLNTNFIKTKAQKKYYKRAISNTIFLVLRNEEKLKDVLKIYCKHFNFVGLSGPLEFVYHVLKNKFQKK